MITADWCGDAMVNVPIFMRIANEALIDARYFIRDEHLDLMDQYLTNGTARSIPIIVIIDQDGKEVGKWGPRSAEAQRFVDEKKPDKDAPDFEEAFKVFAKEAAHHYTTDRYLWKDIEKEIVEVLAKYKPKDYFAAMGSSLFYLVFAFTYKTPHKDVEKPQNSIKYRRKPQSITIFPTTFS